MIRNLGVDWHQPKPDGTFYKRRFASTTVADSEDIALYGELWYTWQQLNDKETFLSKEARYIIQKFIEFGYGDTPIANHVGMV